MTETRYDRAPGDISAVCRCGGDNVVRRARLHDRIGSRRDPHGHVVLGRRTRRCSGRPASLSALPCSPSPRWAFTWSFFLHITTGPDNTNNVLALAFGVLIVTLVVAGSLWIMANLNDNMMPPAELMNLHMQR